MIANLSLLIAYLLLSEPSDSPQNFISENVKWFPYQIKNWMIVAFVINWTVLIFILELQIRKMKLTLFSEVANKFNAFDRQDKKYIKRWILFPWVWMLTVKTIFGLIWMTMVFLMLKLVTFGHKKNESQRLRDFRISFATLVFKYGAYGLMFFMFDVCWVSHKKP